MTKKFFLTHFYDGKFHYHKLAYISQCLIATLVVFATLLALNAFSDSVVIASIGASTFIVFSRPHSISAQNKYLFGGYFIGICIGSVCFALNQMEAMSKLSWLAQHANEIFAAVAVGLCMFCMVVFNVEHPPAAALAMGLVLDEWHPRTIAVTIIAVLLLALFRRIFSKQLINLL